MGCVANKEGALALGTGNKASANRQNSLAIKGYTTAAKGTYATTLVHTGYRHKAREVDPYSTGFFK